MNPKLVNTAAEVIAAAMQQGKKLPATLAIALESAQLLQSPETAAESERLRVALESAKRGRRQQRSRVAELERLLTAAEQASETNFWWYVGQKDRADAARDDAVASLTEAAELTPEHAEALLERARVIAKVPTWPASNPTHEGPDPSHGGLTTHRGRREDCSGPDCGPSEVERLRAELAQRTQDLADVHANREKLRARVDEVVAQRDDLLVESATASEGADPFVPRTERSYWDAIADALNAAHAAGMPVGIDLDGTLTDHNAWSVVWDRDGERWTVAGYEDEAAEADGITRLIAPVQALREDAPDSSEHSPATRLAVKLRTSQPDVTAIDVIDAHTIRATIQPQSLDAWRWWQARFNVDLSTVTLRGSVATATGRHDGVTVHFVAEGVPALLAAAVKGTDE